MSEKSHVSMEQNVCVVCGKQFDTGAILLDKRMRATLERHTVTGMGMCPEHKAKADEGYVALIECDPAKSEVRAGGKTADPGKVWRTGNVVHLRREAWERIFDVPVPEKMVSFVEPDVVAMLERMSKESAGG